MKTRISACAAAVADAAAMSASAATMPGVFGHNMVLQRGQTVPVWGKGEPGEKISVSFAGQTVSAETGADGRWRVDLAPLAANSVGADFRVSGANEIVCTNVVVGEVWFCSGQSNMDFPIDGWGRVKDVEKERAAANWPLIRHFKVARTISDVPLDDVPAKWVETTPETIKPQSAVAYFFGETLHRELGVPVGLLNCSWGGTGIEPWTPAGHPDDLWMLQHFGKWNRPKDVPTVLWNGMVAGLVPFAIKGAIWYQGCHNMHEGDVYIDKTVSLVRGWRREWGQGDFPYFLVQLAPFKYGSRKDTKLAVFQEAQARIPERVPNSGYTVINDVGNVNDIHPTDKRTVGMRMADQVLDRVYGKFVRPWKTPVAKGMKAEGSSLRVSFENAEGLKTRDGQPPTEFEIRDIVGSWAPAAARIEGTDVVLSAEGVKTPIGVRFAPYNGSTPNLVNGAGLPAGPFRLGLPCPFGTAERIAAERGFVCVQRYDIPECCDLRKDPPATLASVKDVKRVGYLLELQDKSGDTKFAFAEMDAFDGDSDNLVLDGKTVRAPVRRRVENLRVFSNVPGAPLAAGDSAGFVEIYYCNYGTKTLAEPEGGDGGKYDFNDTPNPDPSRLGYGCFQVHDLKAKKTVLAFNRFNAANVPCDAGIGNSGKDHPDWTFAGNGREWKARRLGVWVE